MEKHEFGIMQNKPLSNERFDEYQPDKYNCISIDDELIESIFIDLQSIDCYWHTLENKENGLNYYGITLIPPVSMDILIDILSSKNNLEYNALINLANIAKQSNKYIIHFGI